MPPRLRRKSSKFRPRPASLLLASLLLLSHSAWSGTFAWHAGSFDWAAFTALVAEPTERPAIQDFADIFYRDDQLFDQRLRIRNEVSDERDRLSHRTMVRLLELSRAGGQKKSSLLRLFQHEWRSKIFKEGQGESDCFEFSGPQSWGYCDGYQVVLSPTAVRAFYYELRDLLRQHKPTASLQQQIRWQALHDVVKRALLDGRALYFIGDEYD